LLAFIAYQLYRLSEHLSVGLIALTLFDAALVWLTWRESAPDTQHDTIPRRDPSRPSTGCAALIRRIDGVSTTGTGCSLGRWPRRSPGPGARCTIGAATARADQLATPAALGAELERIALSNADLAKGYRRELVPGGAQFRDQVTLDNCGFTVTTETHRFSRRQYAIIDANSRATGVSNELIAYDSPQQATKPIAQWHTAAAHHPHAADRSTMAGTPKLVERITPNQINVPTIPVAVNAITTESVTARGQGTLYNVSMLQGKASCSTTSTSTRPTRSRANDLRATLQLATIIGQRLANTG
jgi:hypothetical protein